MLLIGDIHLTSKIKDKLISKLKEYVKKNSEEKNLIFLGDFVYHFSYDRAALIELYDLFLDRFMQGKNLYILAGNHDRLGNMFVFEEGKKAFEVLKKIQKGNDNEICFITRPEIKTIEGKNILFLPAMLDINESEYEGIESLKDKQYNEDIQSKNKNIVFSAKLNLLVERYTKKYSDLTIIHHYYIEGTSFPGQQAKFGLKDRALSQHRLDNTNLQIISGHLHQAFSFKNYLCTGSIRATSPLECNQLKYFRKRDGTAFEGEECDINYYFQMERPSEGIGFFDERKRAINEKDIINHRKEIQKKSENNFTAENKISIKNNDNLDMKGVTISINVENLQYDNMSHFIDQKLQENLHNVQLKKNINIEKIIDNIDNPKLSGNQSFGAWIDLLKQLLKKKYPNEYEEYEKILQEIEII